MALVCRREERGTQIQCESFRNRSFYITSASTEKIVLVETRKPNASSHKHGSKPQSFINPTTHIKGLELHRLHNETRHHFGGFSIEMVPVCRVGLCTVLAPNGQEICAASADERSEKGDCENETETAAYLGATFGRSEESSKRHPHGKRHAGGS